MDNRSPNATEPEVDVRDDEDEVGHDQFIEEFDGNWTPEIEAAVIDQWAALIRDEAEELAGPPDVPLTTVLTEDLVRAFLRGERTLGDLLGVSRGEAFGIAEFGYNYLVANRLGDAQTIFEALVILAPKEPYFHTCLGAVYQRQGRDREAMAEYSASLSLAPSDVDALVNRGELYLRDGNLEDALSDFEKAMADHPHNHPQVARARVIVSLAAALLSERLGSAGAAG